MTKNSSKIRSQEKSGELPKIQNFLGKNGTQMAIQQEPILQQTQYRSNNNMTSDGVYLNETPIDQSQTIKRLKNQPT